MEYITKPGIKSREVETRDFSDNAANRARELIRMAVEEIKPYNGEHIETFVFSFFSGKSLVTGLNTVDLMTFKVLSRGIDGKEHELSAELRQAYLKDCQSRLLELLGAKTLEVKPKTMEQVADDVSDAEKRL